MNQHQRWELKDKSGNSPSPDDYKKCMRSLQKLDRKLLFPCPRSADDLEMPMKNSAESAPPREMNSFIIFRRQLAHVLKQKKLSDDGKVLSRNASYIWNGASQSERQSYVCIAEELKQRHLKKYPDYTYERRKRKTAEEDFVYLSSESFKGQTKKKRKVQHTLHTLPEPESNLPHEEEITLTSTSHVPEQGNDWSSNSFTSENSWNSYDNTLVPSQIQQNYQSYEDNDCYTYLEDSRDHQLVIGDADIPLVTSSILSHNFADVDTFQQFQLQQIQQPQLPQPMRQQLQQEYQQDLQQQIQQQIQPQIQIQQIPTTYYINDYLITGGDSGIGQSFDGFLPLETPIDELITRNFN